MSHAEEWEEEEDVFKLTGEALNRRAIVAAEEGDPWTLRDCLKAGADASWDSESGLSALEAAVGGGSLSCVELVQKSRVEKGAPRCSKGAVSRAVISGRGRGDGKILRLLLEANKLDPKPLGAEELGAAKGLEAAIDRSRSDEVRVWADGFGAGGARLRGGLTPLMLCAARNELDCLYELVRAGADAGERDHNGATALMVAAWSSAGCARALLTISDPLAEDARGMTALMSACHMMSFDGVQGNAESVRLLAPHSNLEASDRDGRTALMLALSCGAGECADELARAGAGMELSLPGEEAKAVEAMTRAGRSDWAALAERERLDRELAGGSSGAPRARL